MMHHRYSLIYLFLFSLVINACAEVNQLPGYHVDLTQTSVSGLSSGGFMATQLHVAYSDKIMGAGIIAGGPYYCAGSYQFNTFIANAMTVCMNPIGIGPPSKKLFTKAQKFAQKGFIADLAHLKDDKVYLFSGTQDSIVTTEVVDETYKFYKLAGIAAEHIQYNNTLPAGHAIITDNADDNACSKTTEPFINDCDFVQSHRILKHLYGDTLKPAAKQLSGEIITFDQSEFVNNSTRHSMSSVAYAYVPQACEQESCKVHIVFHGCLQSAEQIGNDYYTTTGYNELADTNHIIVLYPQTKSSQIMPFNPKGCWDFWGYSSADFYTRQAPQMLAVMNMLQRLAEPRTRRSK